MTEYSENEEPVLSDATKLKIKVIAEQLAEIAHGMFDPMDNRVTSMLYICADLLEQQAAFDIAFTWPTSANGEDEAPDVGADELNSWFQAGLPGLDKNEEEEDE